MSLIPIEHPRRLASPAEAADFYRGLRERRVSVRGCHTTDPVLVELLIRSASPRHERNISFAGGTLDPEVRVALAALCAQDFEYFEIRTLQAGLRVWPGRYAWVEEPTEEAQRSLFETESITEALARFEGSCGEQIARGHIRGVGDAARAPLLALLHRARSDVHGVLDLSLETACALTESFSGHELDWQANMLLVDFPEGRIHGFLKSPKTDQRHRLEWLERVDKALRRAGLV